MTNLIKFKPIIDSNLVLKKDYMLSYHILVLDVKEIHLYPI